MDVQVGRDQLLPLNNNISKPDETSTTHHDHPLFGYSEKMMMTVPTSQPLHVKYFTTTTTNTSIKLNASKIDRFKWPMLLNNAHHHPCPVPAVRTFNESFDSRRQTSFSSSSTKAYSIQSSSTITSTATPDLELKLGGPIIPLKSTKPCPQNLLYGPISVT